MHHSRAKNNQYRIVIDMKFGIARGLISLLSGLLMPVLTAIAISLSGFSLASADSDTWQYGLMLDFAYAKNLTADKAHEWRNKLTSYRLNQPSPNMGMAYLRQLQDEDSPFGVELALQVGYDTDRQVPDQQRMPGHSWLRYLGRANLSYRLPLGNGLNISAGLMNSFIGFESIWSKDNNHYTRSWMADYSPYYLIGIGAQYPVSDQIQLGLFLLNDYDYLAYKTPQPKYATQLIWSINQRWKFTQNLFAGSEQRSDPAGWRYFSNSILQWSGEAVSLAWAYDTGTQAVYQQQAFWLATMLSGRWQMQPDWAVAIRPELYWDADGLMTGQPQLIKGATATFEYKTTYAGLRNLWRLEYRFDDAQGKQAGFFSGQDQTQNFIGQQQLLFLSCVLSFDSQ